MSPYLLPLEGGMDVGVEKLHQHITTLWDTDTRKCSTLLLLRRTLRMEKDIILKCTKHLENPGK